LPSIFLPILIAVLTGAIIAYISASLLLAQKQLVAATRLQSYLFYWQNWIMIENNLLPILHEAKEWNKQIREIRNRGGDWPQELVKLRDRKREQYLIQVQAQIEKEGFELPNNLLAEEMRKFPKEMVGSILDWTKTSRQNIIEGKTFISDEEAVSMGLGVTDKVIELKMGIIDLIDGMSTIMLSAVTMPEEFSFKDHAKAIAKMMWTGVVVCRNIDSLFEYAHVFTRRSVLKLTLMNIKDGSRLTIRR
jgi:hypothetical protein